MRPRSPSPDTIQQVPPPQPAAEPPATISTLGSHVSARYNLSIGAPSYGPPDAVRHALTQTLKDPVATGELFRYNEEAGIPDLVHTWAHLLFSPPDTAPQPLTPLDRLIPEHHLMVTPGANQAFANILLATCAPGDEVLLPLPYYFSHHTAIRTASLTPVLVKPDPVTLLPKLGALRASITPRTRALVIASPANPSGAVYGAELLADLSALCAERGIWLIVDEVYRDLAFAHPRRVAPAVPMGAHVARLFSMSKSHGIPGLRIGALAYPRHLHATMVAVQDTLATHASTLSQVAALAALRAAPRPGLGERGDLVRLTRAGFERELTAVYASDAGNGLRERFRPGVGGGFYLFLPYWDDETRGRPACRKDDVAAVERLAAEFDVLTVPGCVSGTCGFIRVSCASVPEHEIDTVANALSDGLRALLVTEVK